MGRLKQNKNAEEEQSSFSMHLNKNRPGNIPEEANVFRYLHTAIPEELAVTPFFLQAQVEVAASLTLLQVTPLGNTAAAPGNTRDILHRMQLS